MEPAGCSTAQVRLDGFTQPTLFPVTFLVQQILGIPADTYAFTRELEKLHPGNDHVKEKIRQQLQVLRDAGLLLHLGRGEWRLR